MDTLLLDIGAWDLVVDAYGNIAVASDPYSQAQDAGSQIKTFQGEVYYDTTQGVPYWAAILGRSPPPLSLLKQQYNAAALTVPGVTAAQTFFSGFAARKLTGQVQVTNQSGQSSAAGF